MNKHRMVIIIFVGLFLAACGKNDQPSQAEQSAAPKVTETPHVPQTDSTIDLKGLKINMSPEEVRTLGLNCGDLRKTNTRKLEIQGEELSEIMLGDEVIRCDGVDMFGQNVGIDEFFINKRLKLVLVGSWRSIGNATVSTVPVEVFVALAEKFKTKYKMERTLGDPDGGVTPFSYVASFSDKAGTLLRVDGKGIINGDMLSFARARLVMVSSDFDLNSYIKMKRDNLEKQQIEASKAEAEERKSSL